MTLTPALTAETRRLLALAWPVMLTSLNWTILHVTDVVVVGLTGTEQVAALGASRALTFIGIVVAVGWLSGILVFASRAEGAGEPERTGEVLHQGIAVGLVLGLASGALLFCFAEPLLIGIGVAAEIAPVAARVVEAMALAYPSQLIMMAASFFLEGVSRPRRVMVVNLVMLPMNGVLAWALSGGHLGLPAWGAVGAAAATAIASAFGAVAMVVAAWTLPGARARGVHDWTRFASPATWRGAMALLGFGAVPAIASGLELAGFSVLIALSTQFGETTTHAFQIVFSIHNVTFAAALGLGSAAGVRAGNAMGEGSPAAAAWRTMIAATITAIGIGLLALPLVVTGPWVVNAFPSAPEVHVLAAAMLFVWAPFIVFDGVQIVFVYALRSMGDQVAAGVNSVLAYFVVTGGLGLLLVDRGFGPMALVWASGLGMVTAAVLHGARLWFVSRRLRPKS
jgi:MATE family multidrug resistance protein